MKESTAEHIHKSSACRLIDNLEFPKIDREQYRHELAELQHVLQSLLLKANKKKISSVIVFEGMDAAGKGGAIRRLVRRLDPELYVVRPFAAPTHEQRIRNYLWRFYQSLAEPGTMTIFDRSWYGRVLVERIEGFASEREWSRAYREINDTEEAFVHSGMIVQKFWMHISQSEQLDRFEARAFSPLKQWKLTDEDWRNRKKWPEYRQALIEMLEKTSTKFAPWTVIPGDDKPYARIQVLRSTIDRYKSVL